MKYFAFILGVFAICAVAIAQESNLLQTEVEEQYFQQQNQNPDKSRIYVFFNNQPCPNCPQAIEMIEEVYNQNYLNNYALYTVNYAQDNNAGFVSTYGLSEPLEVVMVEINDGEVQGFQKIEGLEDMTGNAQAFNEYFTTQVNGYLGDE